MTSRALAIINLAGCVALAALITFQWRREQSIESSLRSTANERDAAITRIYELEDDRDRLKRDIDLLKESLAETQSAAEESARQLTLKTELAESLQQELDAAREQIAAWEQAVAARDQRIEALNGQLATTRARLSEAVAKLNEVAEERKR